MSDVIEQTKGYAESHGLEFKDCGNGHVQIKGHGALVNYYPMSKRRTAFNSTTGRTDTHCTPWDAVKLCMNSAKEEIKPKAKPSKRGPDFDVKPAKTKTWVKNLYFGEVPPWDESLGDFRMAPSDVLRVQAKELLAQADFVDCEMES